MRFIKSLGPFRLFLILSSIGLMVCSFFAIGWLESELDDRKLILYVSSALMPIFFFLLLFDMLMNRIQISDKGVEEQNNYRCFIRLEAIIVVLLVASWVPFFISILN